MSVLSTSFKFDSLSSILLTAILVRSFGYLTPATNLMLCLWVREARNSQNRAGLGVRTQRLEAPFRFYLFFN